MLHAKDENGCLINDKRLVVATTHILYNPKRGDCKLAQMQMILANIDKLAYKKSKVTSENKMIPAYYPTIFCGDLNCISQSKMYEFVHKSKLTNYKELNRYLISGQIQTSRSCLKIEKTLLPDELGISDQSQFKSEVDKRLAELAEHTPNIDAYCSFGGSHLRHTFNFKSVYEYVNESQQLEVTSCIQDTKKAVDFIFFHSEKCDDNDDCDESMPNEIASPSLKRPAEENSGEKSELELVGKLRLFGVDELADVGLPNKDYPSDHFLLAAKFILN